MNNPLRPEAALGFVTLLVCLPIAAVLLQVIGVSIADFIANPLKYPSALIPFVGYLTGLTITGLRTFRRKHIARGED